MSVYEKEGIGIPVTSPEDDYVFFLEGWQSVRVSDLLSAAGAEVINEFVLNALQHPLWQQPEEWRNALATYRQNGRQYPPLYRVRVRVEVEPLPEEEVPERWESSPAEES